MSTREEQKEQTKQIILDATVRIILDPTFSTLNTNKLAEEAGVSKGTIFHHFGNKDRLILAALEKIVTDQFEQLMSGNQLNFEELEPQEILRYITKSNLELIIEHPNLTSFLLQVISDFRDKSHFETLEEFVTSFLGSTADYVIPLFSSLGWKEHEAVEAAKLYLAILDGLGIQQELLRNFIHNREKKVDEKEDLILASQIGIDDVGILTDMIVRLFDKRQK